MALRPNANPNIFGYISAFIQIIYFLPQIILLFKSKSNRLLSNHSILNNATNPTHLSKNHRLSYTFLFLEITGVTSSLIYGCLINETPLLLSNAINVFFILLILITKSFNIQNCINYFSCDLFSSRQNHIEYRRPNNIFYSINETENNTRLLYVRSSPRATPILTSPEVPQYDTLSKSVPIEISNKNKKYWNSNKYNRNNTTFENRTLRGKMNNQNQRLNQGNYN